VEKTQSFVVKAGTIVFGIVVLIWVLSVFSQGVEPEAQTASWAESVPWLPGFSSRRIWLLGGGSRPDCRYWAKEAIVASFGMVYGTGEDLLTIVLQNYFTPLSAYAFMAMTLLYSPCAATIGVIKKETNP
jgi:ferrous iron transport protein B